MSTMNEVMSDMLNNITKEDAKKGKIIYFDIDDLVVNPKNKYALSDIELLAENIAEGGLLQPLVIVDKNRIHTGHRRHAALKMLYGQGRKVLFMGKELDNEIPGIYLENKMDDLDEEISMMRSNSYRNFTQAEKKEIVINAHTAYLALVKKKSKPAGREREWITALTGISDGTVKSILAILNKEEGVGEENSIEEALPTKTDSKILKKFVEFNNFIVKVDMDDIALDERDKLDEIINNITELLSSFVN